MRFQVSAHPLSDVGHMLLPLDGAKILGVLELDVLDERCLGAITLATALCITLVLPNNLICLSAVPFFSILI